MTNRYWAKVKETVEGVGVEVPLERLYRDTARVVLGSAIVIDDHSKNVFKLPSEKSSFQQYLSKIVKRKDETLIKLGQFARYLVNDSRVLVQVEGY